MVDQYRAPRQRGCPRTGRQRRLVLLGLIVLLVSAGVAMGIALPRWSDSFTRGPGAAAPQGIEIQPVPAEVVVVGTRHGLTFQLTDADGNPVQEAGRSVQVVIIEYPPPHPHQVEPQLASVDPTEMITNASGQATTTLTVGHTSGLIELVVVAGAETERFVLSALPDRDSAGLVEVSGNNQEGTPGEELSKPLVVQLEDQYGNPIESEPVVFARLVDDGEFVDANAVASRRHTRGPTERLGLARPRQAVPPVVSVTVSTDPEGKASVRYRPGDEALQVVSAQAQRVPNDPVIFRITLAVPDALRVAVNGQLVTVHRAQRAIWADDDRALSRLGTGISGCLAFLEALEAEDHLEVNLDVHFVNPTPVDSGLDKV